VTRYVPFTFVSKKRSRSSAVLSRKGFAAKMPALFTSTSTPPRRSRAAAGQGTSGGRVADVARHGDDPGRVAERPASALELVRDPGR
jgi:hypothetical protein